MSQAFRNFAFNLEEGVPCEPSEAAHENGEDKGFNACHGRRCWNPVKHPPAN